jgi:hypothetical protein
MRKMILITVISLFCSLLTAPPNQNVWIVQSEGMKDQALLKAIIQVESNGNPMQINFYESALGLLQIRPIMVGEVNRIVGYEKYTVKDCLDSLKSIEIYWQVQNYWNPTNDVIKGCQVWNGKSRNNEYLKKIIAVI